MPVWKSMCFCTVILFYAHGINAANAENQPQIVVSNEQAGVPVFGHSDVDQPYEVLGEVSAGVRKFSAFSGTPTEQKIYRELWERARKLGADAVINARYGENQAGAFTYGTTKATGTAIRFVKNNTEVEQRVPAPTQAN